MPARNGEGIELLADPTRRRIIALVADGTRRPTDIASALGITRPAVSRQLRLLVRAGLLRWRWSLLDRRTRDYFIEPAMQPPILAWLAGVNVERVTLSRFPGWSPPIRVHGSRRLSTFADASDLKKDPWGPETR
jgi:hypothetical protein